MSDSELLHYIEYTFCSNHLCFVWIHMRMTNMYSIGENMLLTVKEQGGDLHVTIDDNDNVRRSVTLPSRRWIVFG